MAQSVDQALQAWASRATEDELDAGPRIEDLGGVEAVAAEASDLAAGPQLPYLLCALANCLDELADDQATRLVAAAALGLSRPHSGWVLADAIDVLCSQPGLADRLGSRTVKDLAALAEGALAGEFDPGLAQPAIAGMLRLAASRQATPHRLLALLSEITGTEPADALERLPILIGIAHAHFTETDDLLDVLNALENGQALSPTTRADAAFELALADERRALESSDRNTVAEQLRKALMRFAELSRTHEARLDARAHATAIKAVLEFSDLFQECATITDSARDRIAESVAQLDSVTVQLAAWTGRMHRLDWLSARNLTQSAWSRLVTTLHTAQAHLDQPSWYDPVGALNDLLQIYRASRSIHTRSTDDQGLVALISPAVEASFLQTEGLLHHLEQAVTHDPQFTEHPDAQALYERVHQRRLCPGVEATEEGSPRGKALDGHPALASLFSADGDALREGLDPQLLDLLEQRVHEFNKGYTPTGNERIDAHLENLLKVLATSPAWKPHDCHFFTTLLEQFLRFMYARFDAQANLYGSRTAYLGPAKKNADGNAENWNEKNLQDDFHGHLSAALTPFTVQREEWDVAAGRVDVTYTPQPGSRFVTEVKWRTKSWDQERIRRDYIAQAANYTATGPPFGILLIGDSSDHSSGYRSVDDSIWIITHARSATEVPRVIVTGVLPTSRPTPSGLRAP